MFSAIKMKAELVSFVMDFDFCFQESRIVLMNNEILIIVKKLEYCL